MLVQLQSLQALIKESKSTASVAAHQRHVTEYQALMAVLQERFGDKLALFRHEPADSDDNDESSDEESERDRNNQANKTSSSRRRNNNDEEEEIVFEEKGTLAPRAVSSHGKSKLDREFKTIDFEVREGNYEVNRRKENEVRKFSCMFL